MMIGKYIACLLVLGLCLRAMGQPGVSALQGPARPGEETKGIAVVELFTSEGCSSCPPADELMSKINAAERKRGTGVILLTFHVDYWDRLGWPDRFGSADATKRQRDYAAAMRKESVYTPQVVVNGTTECIGSDEEKVYRAIRVARQTVAATEVTARATLEPDAKETPPKPRTLTIDYAAPTVPSGAVAWAFLVEDGLSTQVKAGENSGKTLRHDRVVRAMASEPARAEGKLTLTIPADASVSMLGVAIVIQDVQTRRVLGAAECEVPR
ncbi:MAG: DUF1223 domain-containing protein [Phycisphaerales bacterium]